MKNKYIICNHKNNFTLNEIIRYKEELDKINTNNVNFIICPSFLYLNMFNNYKLGSQDISAYDRVITGEVSAKELKSLNVSYSLIGHVERKIFLKENYLFLNQKIKQANNNNIKVIYCLSELEKNIDNAKRVLKEDLDNIKNNLLEDAIIAYEPKWAIGNESNLDFEYIYEIINYISSLVSNDIVYGGSVTSNSITQLLKCHNINGFLLGNSSLNIDELNKIITLSTKYD